jgi:hypothetical protein
VSDGGEEAPVWSLQSGIDADTWPEEAKDAVADLRQGTLVAAPPLSYAASAQFPIHSTSRAWAQSDKAEGGVVNVASADKRPPWGLIVTQTCDLVEEGRPKRPWVQVSPVYEWFANSGERSLVLNGRGFDYLVPITGLAPKEGAIWVADLRLLIPVEKGWLVGRETCAGFADEAGYARLASQLSSRFSRAAFATVVVDSLLRTASQLFVALAERYEGKDSIVEVGLALGRSALEPSNAQFVFLMDGQEPPPGLEAHIIDWWQPISEQARGVGLEVLAPRMVSIDELSAREYRSLYLLDASSFSPDDEEPAGAQTR